MKQNNRRTKLKAIVAVVLVMASLFAMASLVSAGFVEEVFSEVCELMTTSSSGSEPEPEECEHENMIHMLTEDYYCYRCKALGNKLTYMCTDCGYTSIRIEHKCS